jgi:hypothetical protein
MADVRTFWNCHVMDNVMATSPSTLAKSHSIARGLSDCMAVGDLRSVNSIVTEKAVTAVRQTSSSSPDFINMHSRAATIPKNAMMPERTFDEVRMYTLQAKKR